MRKHRPFTSIVGTVLMVATFPLLLNFMFLPEMIRYPGPGPILRFQINPASWGIEDDDAVLALLAAAGGWFLEGKSNFVFSYKGVTDQKSPPGFETVICDENRLVTSPMPVYAQDSIDPDCTAESCTFIWTCAGQAAPHGMAVQVNSIHALDMGNNAILKLIALHAFGHAAGLDHCLPGELPERCLSRLTGSQSVPDSGSVMYPFPSGQNHLSDDDRAGLQGLYGILEIPIPNPVGGLSYGLSLEEVQALMDFQEGMDAMAAPAVSWRSPQSLREMASSFATVMASRRKTNDEINREIDAWAEEAPPPPEPTSAEIEARIAKKKATNGKLLFGFNFYPAHANG